MEKHKKAEKAFKSDLNAIRKNKAIPQEQGLRKLERHMKEASATMKQLEEESKKLQKKLDVANSIIKRARIRQSKKGDSTL